MKTAYFFDFDGVICDSIHECFEVSFNAFYKYNQTVKEKSQIRDLFFEYRGLVGPAWQYYYLHDVLNNYNDNFENEFMNSISNSNDKTKREFQNEFFKERAQFKKNNFDGWIRLNPLTKLGNSLIGKAANNSYIITTKDKDSVELILNYFNIEMVEIFSKEEFEKFQTKGKIIDFIMNKSSYEKGVFIDDHVGHLDSVDNDKVECYFEERGYGINTSYPVYKGWIL